MLPVHLQDGVFTSLRFVLLFPPREIGFLKSIIVWEHFPLFSASICVLGRRAERETNLVCDGTPCPQCVIFSTRPFILLSSSSNSFIEQRSTVFPRDRFEISAFGKGGREYVN